MPTTVEVVTADVPLKSTEHRVYFNNAEYNNSSTTTATFNTVEQSKTWSRTPGYHSIVRSGARLPDRGFSFGRQTWSDNLVTYKSSEVYSSGGPWDVKLQESSYQVAYGNFASTRNQTGEVKLSPHSAISNLLSKAKGAEWSLPVAMGEMRETLSMVAKTVKMLASSFRSLRKGNIIEAYRTLRMADPSARVRRTFNKAYADDARKAASNHWLAMQYGWKPLLKDVYDAATTMAELALSSPDDARKVGRVTAQSSLITKTRGSVGIEVSPYSTAMRTQIQTESFKFVWLFSPTELNNLGSLGLLNPLSVAWELVPLSFVVDMFLPIGRYLEHLDVPLRFNHVGGSKGYRRSVSTTFSNFVRAGVYGEGTFTTDFVSVSRDALSDIPSLGLESIRFEPKLGVQRVLSLLALASQAFKR